MKHTDKPIPETHVELLELIQDIDRSLKGTPYEISSSTLLDGLSESLKSQRFSLAVMGPYSSGKSSLINRFIGEDAKHGLLPVGHKETTAKLTKLSYGLPRVTKVWDGSGRMEVIANGEQESREILKTEAKKEEDAALLVEWPSDFFAAGGELVDTPGLFGSEDDRSAISVKAIPTFHSIIFVVRYNETVDDKIVCFLKEHLTKFTCSKFFFLINQIDKIHKEEKTSAEEKVDICFNTLKKALCGSNSANLVRDKQIDNLLKKDQFFGVSALTGDGMGMALQSIRAYLQRGSYEELVLVATGKVDSVLCGIERLQEAQKNAQYTDMKEFGDILRDLEAYNQVMRREIVANTAVIPAAFATIARDLSEEILQAVKKIQERGKKDIKYSWWDRLTSPSDIQKDLEKLRRNLGDKMQDYLEAIDRKWKVQCTTEIQTYNVFYENVMSQLLGYASRMDKSLEKSQELRVQQEGITLPTMIASNEMTGKKDSPFETAAALVAGGAAAYVGGPAIAAIGVHGVLVANYALLPAWLAGHVVAVGGLAAALGVPAAAAVGIAALPLGAAVYCGAKAFFNNEKSTKSIKDFTKWLNRDFERFGDDTVRSLTVEIENMGTELSKAIVKGLNGTYKRLHQFAVTVRDGNESGAKFEANEAIAMRIAEWREINSRISAKVENTQL